MFVAANRSSRSHLQSELVTTFTPSCEHTELEENGRGETKNKETVSQYLINKLLEKSSRRLLKRFSQIPANFSLSPRAGIATRAETERRSKRTNERTNERMKGTERRKKRERERERERGERKSEYNSGLSIPADTFRPVSRLSLRQIDTRTRGGALSWLPNPCSAVFQPPPVADDRDEGPAAAPGHVDRSSSNLPHALDSIYLYMYVSIRVLSSMYAYVSLYVYIYIYIYIYIYARTCALCTCA